MDITPTAKTSPIPYSQHYRCFPQMIGSIANQAVFMYLMDETVSRLKMGKSASFKVSVNEIANKRNANRRTVTNSIEKLEIMNLIEIVDGECSVNIDRFVSLIGAFHNLSSTEDKKCFIEALGAGNDSVLETLGYKLVANGNNAIIALKGGIGAEGDAVVQKCTPCTESHPPVVQKYTGLCKNAQLYPENGDDSCAEIHNSALIEYQMFQKMSALVVQKYTREEFVVHFYTTCTEAMDEKTFFFLVDAIFDQNKINPAPFCSEFCYLLMSIVVQKCTSGLCKNAQEVVQKYTTVNKEIKENKSGSALAVIIGEKEVEQENNLKVDFSSYQQQKQKSTLPFFPVEQIESFIGGLQNCLDRADKIFINQLWDIATSLVGWNNSQDEEGNLTETPVNIEGDIIYADRIMNDLLLPAYEATEEIINRGSVMVNGETLLVTATMLSPDDVQKILDWEWVGLESGYDAYIISKNRFHNIHSTPVVINKRQTARQSRVEDKEYMQKIVLIGEDDNLYSQLTPIELVIYNFLTTHFQISDQGEVVAPLTDYLNRVQLSQSYVQLKEAGLSEEDFLSVLFKNKPSKQDGSLQLKDRMFDSHQIDNWNALHTFSSIVSEFSIPSPHMEPVMPPEEA